MEAAVGEKPEEIPAQLFLRARSGQIPPYCFPDAVQRETLLRRAGTVPN